MVAKLIPFKFEEKIWWKCFWKKFD